METNYNSEVILTLTKDQQIMHTILSYAYPLMQWRLVCKQFDTLVIKIKDEREG